MITDLQYALRSLARSPLVAAVAIVTLAVGIGLNTAVFSIVNALLFRPLAVERPHELIWISSSSTKPNGPRGNMTYPDVLDLRATPVLADAAALGYLPANVAVDRMAVRVSGQIVSGSFFDLLGVQPYRGRLLGREDDRPEVEPVAVISYALWQRVSGGRDDVASVTIRVNGHAFALAGVAPRGFHGPDVFDPADVWVPLASAPSVLPDLRNPLARTSWWLRSIGRLAPGVGFGEARAALRARAGSLAQGFPESHDGFTVSIQPLRGAPPDVRNDVRPISALLIGVTLTVLLIACANVANLLLVRGIARARETAIRIALGASRRRLIRHHLLESTLLAACGGALGLLVSLWLTELLLRFVGAPLRVDVSPDARVLLFTLAASVLTAVIFGILPALRSSVAAPGPALKTDQGWGAAQPRSRLQGAIVAGQLALSLVLLLAAALFLKSLAVARTIDVGFETRNRVAMSFNLRMHGYSDNRADAFHRDLLQRLRATFGIRDASMATLVPMGGRVAVAELTLPDRVTTPDAPRERVSLNHVWPRFFETLAIPVLRGRALDERDLREIAATAVINETMAGRYWPGQSALGMRFSVEGARGPFVEVVGVVRDVFTDEFTERPWASAYLPGPPKAEDVAIIAWASTDPGLAIRTVEEGIRSLDSSVAVFRPMTLEQHLAERLDGERALTRILGLAGGLALTLAAIGLYGVVAYTVARRTREIGVRMALGARPADVTRLVVRDAAGLAALGLACGIPPGIAITALLAGSVVGVRLGDPVAIGGATAALALAMLIASYIPARRAARVDPLVALRTD